MITLNGLQDSNIASYFKNKDSVLGLGEHAPRPNKLQPGALCDLLRPSVIADLSYFNQRIMFGDNTLPIFSLDLVEAVMRQSISLGSLPETSLQKANGFQTC
jgi:hypothetical protein